MNIFQKFSAVYLLLFVLPITTLSQAGKGAGGGGGSGSGGGGASGSGGATAGGAATTSNAPFESVMLAYGALDQSMQALARRTCQLAVKGDSTSAPLIVIIDQASLANLASYDGFERTARFLTTAYTNMRPSPSAATYLTSAAAAADTSISVGSVTGFAQNDTVQIDNELMLITAVDIVNNRLAVIRDPAPSTHSKFARAIDITQINGPPIMTANSDAAGAGGDVFSDITNAVAAVLIAGNTESSSTITIPDISAAIKLSTYLTQNESTTGCGIANNNTAAVGGEVVYPGVYGVSNSLQDFNSLVDNLTNARQLAIAGLSSIPIPSGQGAQMPLKLTAFNSFDATFNQFFQTWFAVNATTGQNGLAPIIEGYNLRKRLTAPLNAAGKPDRQVYAVFVNVAAAGGTLQDRKNALSALTTGDWIRYSGGVIVNQIVFRESSARTILFSDVSRYRTPLTHIKKPINKNSTHYGDDLGDMCAKDDKNCVKALTNQ